LSTDRVNVPLLAQLIPDGVKPGTIFTVEFDPDSQWFSIAVTMIAGFLQAKNHAVYVCQVRPTETAKESISALGIDVEESIRTDALDFDDFYTATLTGGRIEDASSGPERTEEGLRVRSLKVQDLSVEFRKSTKLASEGSLVINPWPPGSLIVDECLSSLARFNEEKSLVEWYESRVCPELRRIKRITFVGISRRIHSDWFYSRFEGFCDGIIDIQLREREGHIKSFLRIRNLKGQPHDSRWHEIEIKPNGEATLVS
jgi:KaiC/GvpD/RAD55 family RecA-like ATPase